MLQACWICVTREQSWAQHVSISNPLAIPMLYIFSILKIMWISRCGCWSCVLKQQCDFLFECLTSAYKHLEATTGLIFHKFLLRFSVCIFPPCSWCRPSLVLLIMKFIGCCGNSDVMCGWSSPEEFQRSSRNLGCWEWNGWWARMFGVYGIYQHRASWCVVSNAAFADDCFLESKLPHLE